MKNIAAIVLLFVCINTYGRDNDGHLSCRQFRNGKFLLDDSLSGKTIIERNGAIQTETVAAKGIKFELHVRWISDCAYTLTFSRMLKGSDHFMDGLDKNMVLTVEIIAVTSNSYTQITTCNINDMRLVNKIVRVK